MNWIDDDGLGRLSLTGLMGYRYYYFYWIYIDRSCWGLSDPIKGRDSKATPLFFKSRTENVFWWEEILITERFEWLFLALAKWHISITRPLHFGGIPRGPETEGGVGLGWVRWSWISCCRQRIEFLLALHNFIEQLNCHSLASCFVCSDELCGTCSFA